MGSRGESPIDRLVGAGMSRPDPESGEHYVLADSHLHAEDDAICPRCLTWIAGRDYVRRTAFGVLQHEVCPEQR